MKKALGLFAGLAVAASAQAAIVTHTFDISGLASEGGYVVGSPTLTYNFGVAGTVILVSFDVNVDPNPPSWSEELQIAIDTTNDLSFDGDIDMSLFGGTNNGNPFAATGSVVANSASSDGLVFLHLYESFDDSGATPDAVYGANSTVTVTYDTIPTPGTSALLGLGAVVAFRRRR